MPTPTEIADRVIQALQKRANPERAEGAQKYFKEKVNFYGLTSHEAREVGLEIFESTKGEWTVREAIQLCEILLPHKYYEARSVAILIFLEFKKDFGPEIFSIIKKWLGRNYLDNWAMVDILCPEAMESLFEKYPPLVKKIKLWTQSPNRWVKRASAVSFISLARHGKYLEAAYDISRRLFCVEDDLVQKANGWLLREAGKTDMRRLEKFLLTGGARIPRTTLRYSIERFPEEKRKKLLAKTKA